MEETGSVQEVNTDISINSEEPDHRIISGFWQRILAFVIDGILLGIFGAICGLSLFDVFAHLGGWGRLVGFSIALAYFGLFNSSMGKGQTIGKRIMKIEVVDSNGQHISPGRSLLRYSILAAPFFLNGAMISPDVIMSPLGYLIFFIIFGAGAAIIYLYIFNRNTRQSLHDLAVGTFVTKTSPPGKVTSSVWRVHFAVVGIWFFAVIIYSVIMTGVVRKGIFPALFNVQRAILASGKVHGATALTGISLTTVNGLSLETTYFSSNAIWKEDPKNYEAAARFIASIVLSNYPDVMKKDILIIQISYGYDIGFMSSWRNASFKFSPAEWKKQVEEKPKK